MENPSADAERIFWPRASETIKDFAVAIANPSEILLTDQEKQSVLHFESELFQGRYGNESVDTPLSQVPSTVDTAYDLIPEFFTTSTGSSLLGELLGVTDKTFATAQEASDYLRTIPFEILKDKKTELEKLEGESYRYAKKLYSDAALADKEVQQLDSISLNRDPDPFMRKLSSFVANKRFIQNIQRDLTVLASNDDSPSIQAKLTIAQIYRDKINADIAAMYPAFEQLILQYNSQPEGQKLTIQESMDQLGYMATTIRAAFSEPERKSQFLRLLDYVRNGAAIDKNGHLTAMDENILIDAAAHNEKEQVVHETVFTPEQVEALSKKFFDAEEMKTFIDAYFDAIGIEGWVAEIRQDTDSFAVIALKKMVKVPASFSRSVAQEIPVTGVVGLIEHEIGGNKVGHVMQTINAARDKLTLKIGTSPKYRGKRAIALREAGGTYAEADAMEQYFGQHRRINTGYAMAFKVLASGGNIAHAVRAFAESYNQDSHMSQDERAKLYELAADRVMRLLRYGGYNSQPLHYVEAATIQKVLRKSGEDIQQVMMSEAVFDPLDMLRLHRFGLLNTDQKHLFKPNRAPKEVIQELLKAKLS